MFRYPALFAFILAFLLRLGYSVYIQSSNPESIYFYDSWGYLNIAKNLYQDGVYSQMMIPPQTPDSTRTPLYPLFILLFHFAQISGAWIVYAQALIGGLTAYVGVRAAQIIQRENRANVFVGIWISADIASIFYSNVVGTEALFTLLTTTSIYFAIKGIRFREESAVHWSILFMALATFCRPITLYFLISLPILYFFTSGFALSTRIKTLLFHLGIIAVFIAPWIVRNNQIFGSPFYSSIGETNLLFHTCTQVRGIAEGRPAKPIEMEYRENALGQLDFVNDPRAITPFRQIARKETMKVLRENPGVFGQMWAVSNIMFFIKPIRGSLDLQLSNGGEYHAVASVENRSKGGLFQRTMDSTSKPIIVLIVIQILLLITMYGGIVLSVPYWLKHNHSVFLLLLYFVLYMSFISAFTEVDARFRVPVIPALALLAVPFYKRVIPASHE